MRLIYLLHNSFAYKFNGHGHITVLDSQKYTKSPCCTSCNFLFEGWAIASGHFDNLIWRSWCPGVCAPLILTIVSKTFCNVLLIVQMWDIWKKNCNKYGLEGQHFPSHIPLLAILEIQCGGHGNKWYVVLLVICIHMNDDFKKTFS